MYVRDGLVYYLALKQRARAGSTATCRRSARRGADTVKGWTPARQLAFWINAYNAFVLRTVIDSYPIRGKRGRLPGEQHPPDPRRVRAAHASAPAGAR